MKPLFKDLFNYNEIEELHLFNGDIANENRVYLLGRIHKDNVKDSKLKKRELMYQRDNPLERQLTVITTLSGYTDTDCEMSYYPEEQCFLSSTGDKNCIIKGSEVISDNDEQNASITKMRLIGEREYAPSSKRRVFYRDNDGKHQLLGAGQAYQNYDTYDRPLDEDDEPDVIAMITEDGFNDVDGFNENHIYAVGGKGDVWRYSDSLWTQCGFPTNLDLENVCCGEDGLVYISGLEGMTYVGTQDNWTALKNPELSLPFKDVAWYDGKVWATNDYGTSWITPNGIMDANIPDEVKVCSGRLHANAGMLLVVGLGGAALFENGEWQLLFSYSEFIP